MLRTLLMQQSGHQRDEYDFKYLHRELRRRAWPFSDMHVTEKPALPKDILKSGFVPRGHSLYLCRVLCVNS
jgi:hypothetical protein